MLSPSLRGKRIQAQMLSSNPALHLFLVVTLCSCLMTTTWAATAGTNTWNPPLPPPKFTIKGRMFYPSQSGDGLPAPIPIRVWVNGDDIAIVYPSQGYKLYTHFRMDSDMPTYVTYYNGALPANQSLHCSVYNGFTEVDKFLRKGTEAFILWWVMMNLVNPEVRWTYGGEKIDIKNDDKATVTGVIWNKNFDVGSLTLLMNKDNLKPVRVEVGGPSSVGSTNAAADGAFVMVIDEFSEKFDSDKVHIPPKELGGCPSQGSSEGVVTPTKKRNLKQVDMSKGSWEDAMNAAQAFFSSLATGLADDIPWDDLLPHLVNYTMGPLDASEHEEYTLLGKAVTSIKMQASCGSCWAFSAIAALETAVYVQSGGTQSPVLSQQFLMNCVGVGGDHLSGCFGGANFITMELIAQLGGTIPLLSTYPYAAVNGKCRTDVGGFNVGLESYSHILTIEQMKNAILNYGAPSVAVDADSWVDSATRSYADDLATRGMAWPFCNNQTFKKNHEVVVIGWKNCEWPIMEGMEIVDTQPGECWILLNSWGRSWGASGTMFIPMRESGTMKDGEYGDCGILQTSENAPITYSLSVKLNIGRYAGFDEKHL